MLITKDKFTQLVQQYLDIDKNINTLADILGCDIYNNIIVEGYWSIFEELMKSYFNEEGFEDIMWWLTDKKWNPELQITDGDGSIIPTETIDDLWNLVVYNRR